MSALFADFGTHSLGAVGAAVNSRAQLAVLGVGGKDRSLGSALWLLGFAGFCLADFGVKCWLLWECGCSGSCACSLGALGVGGSSRSWHIRRIPPYEGAWFA